MVDTNQAETLKTVIIAGALVPTMVSLPVVAWQGDLLFAGVAASTLLGALGLAVLLHRDPARGIPVTLVTVALLLTVLTPLTGGYSGPMTLGWSTLTLLTALCMGTAQALGLAGLATAYLMGLYALESVGIGPISRGGPVHEVVSLTVVMFVVAGLAGQAMSRQRALLGESERLGEAARVALVERDAELDRRAHAEGKLREAVKETARASAAKSEFLANMSHELRTPLNAIIGYAEILQEEIEDIDQLDDLGRIRGAGKHLLTLINDVLDLSKIEAGKMELIRSEVVVDELLDDLVATLGPAIAANGNRFVVDRAADLGSLYSDGTRIQQVLLNLLSNAAKFTSDGEVRLDARRIGEAGRERLVFEVHDTGIGITPAQMARLFRPFTQADGSTSRRYGGTGLGLVLARHFAQMMEGEVSVISEPGVGSTFTLELPVHTVASDLAHRQATRVAEAGHAARRVPVVQGDGPAREGVRHDPPASGGIAA